ncbi:MAG: hypothetical protein IJZ87_03965 [Bacteroidales bacterium]|nr:hypothetical protein [Bacteroidales bacterium]
MKNGYLDFEEYIRQDEPEKKKRAEAWRVAIGEQANLSKPEQVPEQVNNLLHTNNTLIIGLINIIGCNEFSISQLMEKLGLKHRPKFLEYHLNPAIKDGIFVCFIQILPVIQNKNIF